MPYFGSDWLETDDPYKDTPFAISASMKDDIRKELREKNNDGPIIPPVNNISRNGFIDDID